MNSVLQNFLDAHLTVPGLLGWGVRLPEQLTQSHSLTDSLQNAHVDATLKRVLMAAEGLPRHQLTPGRLLWRFDKMTICLALRPDPYALCLLVARQEGGQEVPETVLADFQALTLED
jgi:hypothetical protein